MARPWGVYKAHELFGSRHVEAELEKGKWVRALPEPLPLSFVERLRAAWYVFSGAAVAVKPPVLGELEETIIKGNIDHLVTMINDCKRCKVGLRESLRKLEDALEQAEYGTLHKPACDGDANVLQMRLEAHCIGKDYNDALNALQRTITSIRNMHVKTGK